MSNAVKWTDWRSFEPNGHRSESRRSAWLSRLQFAGCVIGLAGLAAVLPAPGSWPAQLAGPHTVAGERVAVVAVAEQAVLLAASVLVWALMLWSIAVAGALTAAGLPGLPGRYGRILLSRIAPAAAGKMIAAAVGVSLIAGTSACAAPWATAGSQPDATAIGSSAPQPPASASITIDWPEAQASAAGPALTTPTSPASPTSAPPTAQEAPGEEATGEESPQPSAAIPPARADQAAPAPTDGPMTAEPAAAPPAASTAPAPAGRGAVTVRPGDSLWSIAKAAMPAPATDSEIDTAWRAWYAANEAVIGSNPNLIEPGQLLSAPTTPTESGR